MMRFWMAWHGWFYYLLLDRTKGEGTNRSLAQQKEGEGQLPSGDRGQGKPFGQGIVGSPELQCGRRAE